MLFGIIITMIQQQEAKRPISWLCVVASINKYSVDIMKIASFSTHEFSDPKTEMLEFRFVPLRFATIQLLDILLRGSHCVG